MTDATLPIEAGSRTPDLLSVISRAAADPAVDVMKMESLLRLQREVMKDAAAAEFNAAYTRLTDRIPAVKKNGTIALGAGRSVAFARWEDINVVIQPLLRAEGFGLTYTTRQEDTRIVVIGKLVHIQGHSISAELAVPPDTGPGRNPLQAIGSAIAYGKRYVTEMLLNIVREGQDDDGAGGAPAQRRGRAPSGFRPTEDASVARMPLESSTEPDSELIALAWTNARGGMARLERFCTKLTREQRAALKTLVIEELQPVARAADEAVALPVEDDDSDLPEPLRRQRDPADYLGAD